MAVIETWLHQDLQEPVKVNHLDGNLFSNNGNGNRIGIVLTNNGEALASISGTVSGYVVTADGSTVPCTGSKSGNRASILIPAAAYHPGSIFITVFVTDGTTVTTIGAVSTTVMRSRTNAQVDPGSAVTDWTQTINAAMQSVETAAANLGGIVAVPYASITFPVPLGKYTYYNNNLYRCITPIASSESFTAAHWTQVRLGDDVSDLKSALNQVEDSTGVRFIDFVDGAYIYTGGNVGTTLTIQETINASYAYAVATVSPGDTLHITGKCSGNAYLWTFINSQNVILSKSVINATGDDLQITAPASAAKVVINTLIANKGISYIGTYIKDAVSDIEKLIQTEKLITTDDLVEQNSNFTITNGNITCDSMKRPFNSLQIAANKIEFDYARVGTGHPLFIGVSINGHFVGNETRQVVTTVVEIYDQSNILFSGATVDVSTGDTQYSSTPAHYTAEVNQNVFTLKREGVTIFKFTVANAYTIDGIAFLNYNFAEILNCVIIKNHTLDGLNNLYKNVGIADIVGKDSKHYRIVAGVIRNSGSGWQFIIDENHQGDLNCVSVSSNASGQIVIDYSAIATKKVISLLVCPDESFASRGYICGSSVGRNQAYVEIYKYAPVSVCGCIICQNDGTIEISSEISSGIISATWDSENNRMHIVHSGVDSSAVPLANPAVYSTTIPRVYSTSGTSVDLQFVNISDGTIATEVTNKLSFRFQRTNPNDLQLVKQDANNIVSTIGNFWFIGIFEV